MKNKFFICVVLLIVFTTSIVCAASKTVSFGLSKYTLDLGIKQRLDTLIVMNGYELDYDNFRIEGDPEVIRFDYDGNIKTIGTGITELCYDYQGDDGKLHTAKCFVEVKSNSLTPNITYHTVTLYNGDIATKIQCQNGYKPSLPEMQREGYTFGGWYLDKEFTKPYTLTWLNDNLTLYAKWTEGQAVVKPNVVANKYNDLDGHWAQNKIEYITRQGLFNGTSETTFSPYTSMTRGMLVTVLGRFYGLRLTGRTSDFEDVAKGAYYEEYVAWAKECGIVNGVSEKCFEPNRNITVEELATILGNYINYTKKEYTKDDKINFKDAIDISDWAKDGVLVAQSCGILKDIWKNTEFEGKLMPKKEATRAEVAVIFYNYLMVGRQ